MRGARRSGSASKALLPLLGLVLVLVPFQPAQAENADDLPVWLRDRGPGLPTSLFGSYVEKGELLFYPFYEFVYNSSEEYTPTDFGFGGPTSTREFKGELKTHELLLFLAYAPTDWLAFEFETEYWVHSTLDKDPADFSTMPSSFTKSGFGGIQLQARWRWWDETEYRPYFYNFLEVIPPTRSNTRSLIGNSGWEIDYGMGLIKGFRWGTLLARASMKWDENESKVEFGEYAFEYLKRVNESWRLFTGIEGTQDEVGWIGEVQYFFNDRIYLKLNCGVGITEKAPDVAPEVGVVFSFFGP